MDDPYHLQRFIEAQDAVYDRVRAELRDGHKRSHWMWFIFPQIRGLGSSETSRRFAISGRDEALAYLAHPVLGPRLEECTRLVSQIEGRSAHDVFGSPDDMKFHSCLTLFGAVAPERRVFSDALSKYFDGQPDKATTDKL